MSKFSRILLKALKETCDSCYPLDGNGKRIDNPLVEDLEQFTKGEVTEDTNEFFMHIDNFFRKIPNDIWETEAKEIALMIDMLSYQQGTKIYNQSTKYLRTKKGGKLKEYDISALNKALPILGKLFQIKIGEKAINTVSDIPSDMIDSFPPSYLDGIKAIDTIRVLIENIKSGEYDQGFYYEQKQPSKEEIEKYLEELNHKYNANGTAHIKKFIDGLNPYQYANLLDNEE